MMALGLVYWLLVNACISKDAVFRETIRIFVSACKRIFIYLLSANGVVSSMSHL